LEGDAGRKSYCLLDRADRQGSKNQMALLWVLVGLRMSFHHLQYLQREKRAPDLAFQQEIQSFHHWHALQADHR
jgi:hypothetical protein